MVTTPGLVVPSAFSSKEAAGIEIRRRSDAADFTPFIEPDVLEQSSTFVGEYLTHYGVKGMKWGQIRTRARS